MARPQVSVHDKTSYNIHPTPPSPSRLNSPSPPSLSSSHSNSASSSAEPSTPPPRSNARGRTRKLYPESIGRVPLHRRGTSKTYERLEDLLREAGYKETRIFTPETERTAPPDDTKSPTLGATVVGFLSNLVPSRSSSVRRGDESESESVTPAYSPPKSPLQGRTPTIDATPSSTSASHHPRRNSHVPVIGPRASSPSLRSSRRNDNGGDDVPGTMTLRRSYADLQVHRQRTVESAVVSPLSQGDGVHHPAPQRTVNRYYQHLPSSSNSGSGTASPPPVHLPTPTRASAYLRHMTSYERPQSTPPGFTRIVDNAAEETPNPARPPRMPSNWMDNVKRAREYFGTPLPPISGSPVRLERSVSARGRTNDRNGSLAPPLLTARLTSGRARRSESQVSVGRVVCRSRGSSPVRREKGKGRATEARLDLEGHFELPDSDEDSRSRFLSGWGVDATAVSAQLLSPPRRREPRDLESTSDVSSEGEDEITLARILVPSRAGPIERSRSIRSLRMCLERGAQQTEPIPPVPPLPADALPSGSGRWSVSLSWGRARGAAEQEDPTPFSDSRQGSLRRRSGLPSWES